MNVKEFRIWQQTLLPSVITIILYFLIFGKVVGWRIGMMDNGVAPICRLYSLPGLMQIMAVIKPKLIW
ncbi:hypothetical protein ACP8HZ_05360 [Francisella noatunensis]